MSRQAKNYTRGKNFKGKSKHNYSKRKGNTEDQDFKSNGKTHNDIGWYIADNQILQDAARLPYSIPTGMPYTRTYVGQTNTGEDNSVPGILAMKIFPTMGYANTPYDPVNVAAQGIYSFVRHLNSGARNYDPVDLMLYIGAMDSVYSILSFATRLYATICSYTQGNRYLPQILFSAQGVDFVDFANNMVSFRSQLNQRIAKASQLMVPKVMPLFERHRWLFANYYIEGDSMKDQIYLYHPAGFYQFGLDTDGAGCLYPNPLPAMLTVSGLMSYIDSMLDPILQDEDFNIMSGDIYKAYGGNIVTMGLIPDLITMNFTYDESVLLQFKNAKPKQVGTTGIYMDNFFFIHQDASKRYLIMDTPSTALVGYMDAGGSFNSIDASSASYDKALARTYALMWSKNTLLTSPHANVEAAENMINTRGTMAPEVIVGATADKDSYRFFFGSEWYISYKCWKAIRNRSNGAISFANYECEFVNISSINVTDGVVNIIAQRTQLQDLITMLTKFKYHPEYYMVSFVTDGNNTRTDRDTVDSLFEIDNYSLVDYNVIKGLHDAALLGEFNIPRIALTS